MAHAAKGEASTTVRPALELFPDASEEVRQLWEKLDGAEAENEQLHGAYVEANSRYRESQETSGGCFPRPVGGSSSLQSVRDAAMGRTRKHFQETVYVGRLDLAQALSKSSGFTELQRAAAIQGLFQSSGERRFGYTSRFLTALERLDAELQTGQTICVHRDEEPSGIFRVLESGVQVTVVDVAKNEKHWKAPRIIVSTKSVEGTFVTEIGAQQRGLEIDQKPEGVVVYGVQARTSGNADGLEVLERNFHSLQLITAANAYALGPEVTDLVKRLTTLESLLYLVAARSINELLDMDLPLEKSNVKKLRDTLLSTFAGRIMCTTVPDPNHLPYWHSMDSHKGVGAKHLHSEHPRILGALANILGVSPRVIRGHTQRIIDQLEHDILVAGTVHASQFPAVEIGRKRLEPFLRETGFSK